MLQKGQPGSGEGAGGRGGDEELVMIGGGPLRAGMASRNGIEDLCSSRED